jgi:hypothetical protein
VVKVTLNSNEIRSAYEVSRSWKCNSKTGDWGGGIIDNPVFPGLLGELAFGHVFRQPVDLERHDNGGNLFDFKLMVANMDRTITVDLKTSNQFRDVYSVKCQHLRNGCWENKNLPADAYGFAFIHMMPDEGLLATVSSLDVYLDGVIFTERMRTLPVKQYRQHAFRNFTIERDQLIPMEHFSKMVVF